LTEAAGERVVFQRIHGTAVPDKPDGHLFGQGKRARYFRKILKFHIAGCKRPQGHSLEKTKTIQDANNLNVTIFNDKTTKQGGWFFSFDLKIYKKYFSI